MGPVRGSTAVAAWLGIAIGFACTGNPLFLCHDSSDCTENGVDGTCQPGGLCSFPDDDCTTGQRYGNHAGNVSGECVPNVDETGGEATTASSATATSNATATTNPVVDGTSTGEPTDTTTTDPDPMTSTSAAASTGEGSTTSEVSAGTDSGGTNMTAQPYGLCDEMTPCPQDWMCVDFTGMGNTACVHPCGVMGVEQPCPPHPDGLDVTCYAEGGANVCLMTCGPSMMQMCPPGFSCVEDMTLTTSLCVPS